MARAQHAAIAASPIVPLAVSVLQLEAFTRRYYECFNQRWFDEAEIFVDSKALFTYPLAKEYLIGRAGYRELTRRWLEGFPDAQITITAVHILDGQTAVTDWIGEGTHLGLLELPGFPPIPATGVHTTLPMRETITIVDGRIVASSMAFDPAELARRLGLTLGGAKV